MPRSGQDYELEIFDHASSGQISEEVLAEIGENFSESAENLIDGSKMIHPNRRVGKSLYRLVQNRLKKVGIDPGGLRFLDALDTSLDWFHFSDGLFYLPSIPGRPGLVVTIDAFNIETKRLTHLRDLWWFEYKGDNYSSLNLQTDLFQYKDGLKMWKKMTEQAAEFEFDLVLADDDFRKLAIKGRPENHLVITPYHTEKSESRRVFAQMVANYLIKAYNEDKENLAQQSP